MTGNVSVVFMQMLKGSGSGYVTGMSILSFILGTFVLCV
jgi:hypothetical protein